MVTVISSKPHPSVVEEVICENCGSTLQYVPRDIKAKVDNGNYTRSIDCPTCSHEVLVRPTLKGF